MARPTAGPGRSTSPPRPSEGQGKPLCGRRVGPLLFWDLVALFCWQRVTGTQGLFVWDGGVFCAPTQALFHTHLFLFPAPGFFFFLQKKRERWPSGPRMDCQPLYDPMPNSERCSENTQEHPEKSRLRTPAPPLLRFLVVFRGKCCAFFSGVVFREIPLIVLFFYRVLLFLGFFVRRVF